MDLLLLEFYFGKQDMLEMRVFVFSRKREKWKKRLSLIKLTSFFGQFGEHRSC